MAKNIIMADSMSPALILNERQSNFNSELAHFAILQYGYLCGTL